MEIDVILIITSLALNLLALVVAVHVTTAKYRQPKLKPVSQQLGEDFTKAFVRVCKEKGICYVSATCPGCVRCNEYRKVEGK